MQAEIAPEHRWRACSEQVGVVDGVHELELRIAESPEEKIGRDRVEREMDCKARPMGGVQNPQQRKKKEEEK